MTTNLVERNKMPNRILNIQPKGSFQVTYDIDIRMQMEATYHYPGQNRTAIREEDGRLKIYVNIKDSVPQLSVWLLPYLTDSVRISHDSKIVDFVESLPDYLAKPIREHGFFYLMPESIRNFLLYAMAFALSGHKGERILDMKKAYNQLFSNEHNVEISKHDSSVLVKVRGLGECDDYDETRQIIYYKSPSVEFTRDAIIINPNTDDVESILLVYSSEEESYSYYKGI